MRGHDGVGTEQIPQNNEWTSSENKQPSETENQKDDVKRHKIMRRNRPARSRRRPSNSSRRHNPAVRRQAQASVVALITALRVAAHPGCAAAKKYETRGSEFR